MPTHDIRVLDVLTGPDTLEHMAQTLDALFQAHPEVPHQVRTHIGIAVSEIAANIIEHAAPHRTVRLVMEALLFATAIQVNFIDDGDPITIDPDTPSMPDLMAERGRGLALARSVLRSLTCHHTHLGNRWTLISRPFQTGTEGTSRAFGTVDISDVRVELLTTSTGTTV